MRGSPRISLHELVFVAAEEVVPYSIRNRPTMQTRREHRERKMLMLQLLVIVISERVRRRGRRHK